MVKIVELPIGINHDLCATSWIERAFFDGVVWEHRYCYNHELHYKTVIKGD